MKLLNAFQASFEIDSLHINTAVIIEETPTCYKLTGVADSPTIPEHNSRFKRV
jgi:hypothetical protein